MYRCNDVGFTLLSKSSCSRLPSGTSAQKSVIVISVSGVPDASSAAGTGVTSGLLRSHIPKPKTAVSAGGRQRPFLYATSASCVTVAPHRRFAAATPELFQSAGVDSSSASWLCVAILRT